MEIVPVVADNVEATVSCLVDAFANDPQLMYFFPEISENRLNLVKEFFSILLEVRLKLEMPVLQIVENGRVSGAVMGYDSQRPDWPKSLAVRFAALEAKDEGLAARLTQTDHAMNRLKPIEPHFYLGVVGVSPAAQGRGVGKALVEAFLSLSDQDPLSNGTFLETANTRNLTFYQRAGFAVLGEASLDNTTSLWCLFRPKP